MGEAMWRFASNGNAGYTGINDSGIETFSAKIVHSLVRETIQNALDARKDESKPVVVEFKEFNMDVADFPGYDSFSESIHACLRDNTDEDAKNFFIHAAELIDGEAGDTLRVLRISDFNTIGLEGAETGEKGSNWSRLIKEKGSSNKNKTAQGSFGIGKAAPFACSDFRTVFYSSLYKKSDGKGIWSHIGVARLISFKDAKIAKENNNDGWTTGMGFYSDSEKLNAILTPANLDPSFTRKDNETGTDIYITGFMDMDNFEASVKKYVLLNFLISIWKGLLTVKVNDTLINKDSLQGDVWNLNGYDDKEIKALKDYYDLLTKSAPEITIISLDAKKYGETYGFKDGECELRLKEGKGLNSRILLTRKSGMRLFEQKNISGSIDFTGILLMTGPNMNAAFREMEVPSHDNWAPDRIKDTKRKKLAEKMLTEFRAYLRACVKESFGHTDENILDAIGVSEFLPDDLNDKANGEKTETIDGDIIAIKTVSTPVSKPPVREWGSSAVTDEPGEKGEETGKKVGRHRGRGGTGKSNSTGDPGEGMSGYSYKKIEINARVRASDPRNGEYFVEFISPKNLKQAKIALNITNERGKSCASMDIQAANLVVGNGEICKCNNNEIVIKNVKKDEKIRIQCSVNMNRYCMMEAVYYEGKK